MKRDNSPLKIIINVSIFLNMCVYDEYDILYVQGACAEFNTKTFFEDIYTIIQIYKLFL